MILKIQGKHKVTVSKAGRYTAEVRRCPSHEPVTRTINVITKDRNYVSDKKICTVFGDPHVLTFDGKGNDGFWNFNIFSRFIESESSTKMPFQPKLKINYKDRGAEIIPLIHYEV